MDLIVAPAQIELADAVISLEVERAAGGWSVVVVVSRPADSPTLSTAALALRAEDAQGAELPAHAQSEGALPEAGGSLGTSANARYVVRGEAPPTTITVRYGGGAARFAITKRGP